MRFVGLLSLLVLGASAPSAGAEEIEVKPRLNGEIRGTVIALETGVAIKSAIIRVKGTGLERTTGGDGFFKIDNVPPGTYTLEIWAMSCRRVEVRGVHVAWTQSTRIAMPLALPKYDLPREPLILELGDIETVAAMLNGTLPPRLTAPERCVVRVISCPIVTEPVGRGYAGRSFKYPWVHRFPMRWDELREERPQNRRIERASVTWTESWRNRLE